MRLIDEKTWTIAETRINAYESLRVRMNDAVRMKSMTAVAMLHSIAVPPITSDANGAIAG